MFVDEPGSRHRHSLRRDELKTMSRRANNPVDSLEWLLESSLRDKPRRETMIIAASLAISLSKKKKKRKKKEATERVAVPLR